MGKFQQDLDYQIMQQAISLSEQCPPVDTAYNVGCIMTISNTSIPITDGYSRELPGNTHAEQCAIIKLQDWIKENKSLLRNKLEVGERDSDVWGLTMYTTMEPCSKRLSGNKPCVQTILEHNKEFMYVVVRYEDLNGLIGRDTVSTGTEEVSDAPTSSPNTTSSFPPTWVSLHIDRVVLAIHEPSKFVSECEGVRLLKGLDSSVKSVDYVRGLESEVIRVNKNVLGS